MFTLILKHLFCIIGSIIGYNDKSCCLFPDSFSCGKFSTDRTMQEYNAEIWKLQALPEMPMA